MVSANFSWIIFPFMWIKFDWKYIIHPTTQLFFHCITHAITKNIIHAKIIQLDEKKFEKYSISKEDNIQNLTFVETLKICLLFYLNATNCHITDHMFKVKKIEQNESGMHVVWGNLKNDNPLHASNCKTRNGMNNLKFELTKSEDASTCIRILTTKNILQNSLE